MRPRSGFGTEGTTEGAGRTVGLLGQRLTLSTKCRISAVVPKGISAALVPNGWRVFPNGPFALPEDNRPAPASLGTEPPLPPSRLDSSGQRNLTQDVLTSPRSNAAIGSNNCPDAKARFPMRSRPLARKGHRVAAIPDLAGTAIVPTGRRSAVI